MKNKKHLKRLVDIVYEVEDFPELDEYGSTIFGYSTKGTWRLFRHITRTATANVWVWNPEKETASYPKSETVPTFEDFATVMLHEVAHGWCYFYKKNLVKVDYPIGLDEELICWNVSKLVCGRLKITYKKRLEILAYRAYLLLKDSKVEEFQKIIHQMPVHLKR